MRRVNGLLAQVNYTLSESRGTGSTGSSNYYVSYLEGEYPKTLSLLSYDQTHTANAVIDYRSEAMSGIMKDSGFNMKNISLEGLDSGIYIVSFSNGNDRITKKLVIN